MASGEGRSDYLGPYKRQRTTLLKVLFDFIATPSVYGPFSDIQCVTANSYINLNMCCIDH